ncbi:MAG: Hsp70 family protein [Clostridia bacterium]|nr:Hsp70 family protein [Clostridia bacterium]
MKYIGIDIGDGESAVAVLEEDSIIEPVIEYLDGCGSIISVVGMSGTDVLIGEKALIDRKVVHLRSRFKSRFLSTLDSERDIERFAHGLRSALLREEEDFFDGDITVAVGCPAGWKEMDRQRYAEILKKAGFENVHIVSESRAAFFYARYAHELKVAPEMLNQTTLVIDIGSSTTDFAYIVDGKESAVGTFGDVNLGGGLIEAGMLRRAMFANKKKEILEDVFKRSPSWKNRVEIAARRLKEQYFLSEDEWKNTPCVGGETVYYDEPVRVKFELNEDIMDEILSMPMEELHGATFYESLSDVLRHTYQSTLENPPKLVILTGGASRMRFFREAVERQFPNSQVILCPNPEYSIAKGLAYAARIDKKLQMFNSDIQNYFESGDIRDAIHDSIRWLTVPLASILSGRIIHDVVMKVLADWKKGEIKTINDMEKPIIERTNLLLSGLKDIPEICPAIDDWCQKLFARVQPQLDEICRKHDVDRACMSLNYIKSIAGPDQVNIIFDNPTLSGIVYIITGAVTATICGGGGIALLTTGLPGILIGAILGIAVAYFGKKVIASQINKADLPKLTRAIIYRTFKGSLSSSRQRRVIEDALLETMEKPEFEKTLETEVTISIEDQIMKLAKNVEMPIVQ